MDWTELITRITRISFFESTLRAVHITVLEVISGNIKKRIKLTIDLCWKKRHRRKFTFLFKQGSRVFPFLGRTVIHIAEPAGGLIAVFESVAIPENLSIALITDLIKSPLHVRPILKISKLFTWKWTKLLAISCWLLALPHGQQLLSNG